MDQRVLQDGGLPKRITLSEPFVLLSIIGMAVLSGVTNVVEKQIIIDAKSSMEDRLSGIFSFLTPHFIPVPGIIALAFFSELHGRRPVFITLCAMSVLAAILAATPVPGAVILVTYILTTTAKGGLAMMAMICIPEYCRPRHRFTCLIVYCIAVSSGVSIATIWLKQIFIPIIYFKIYMIVLSVACLGGACFWPESPYWLAARGRCTDAAHSLRKLRGESVGSELNQLSERRDPGSFKVYYRSFICVLGLSSVEAPITPLSGLLHIICVFVISDHYKTNFIILFVGSFCLLTLTAIISYKVKRKSIYLASAFAGIVSGYTSALWINPNSYMQTIFFSIFVIICQIVINSGPGALTFVVASEMMPQKYNTVLACCYQVFKCILEPVIILLVVGNAAEMTNTFDIQITVYITLAVPGLILGYFLVPDTKDKTLFEIQKSYIPDEAETPEQGQMLENVNTVSNETHSKRET